jgi:hypothetical protein
MIKAYIPFVFTFVICATNTVLADIADFARNRDITVSEEGLQTSAQGYNLGSEGGKKIYSKKDYKLTSEELSNGQARKLLEIQKKSTSEKESSGSLQMARFSGSVAASLTKCEAIDRASDSALTKNSDARNFKLQGCATATPRICASLASFLGKNSELTLKKITDCRDVTDAMSALQKTMNEPLYKKTSDNNVQELSDAYYEMVRPNATLKNKVLDSRKESNRATAPETSLDKAGSDIANLVELTSACSRLDEINEDGVYSTAKKKQVSQGNTKSDLTEVTK